MIVRWRKITKMLLRRAFVARAARLIVGKRKGRPEWTALPNIDLATPSDIVGVADAAVRRGESPDRFGNPEPPAS
jgi:hypothetical protein